MARVQRIPRTPRAARGTCATAHRSVVSANGFAFQTIAKRGPDSPVAQSRVAPRRASVMHAAKKMAHT
jgi:hypothetical protein